MSIRKLLTTLIIPIILLAGLGVFLLNNRRAPGGELVLTPKRLDVGTLREWEGTVTETVIAQNIGKVPLHIQQIQTGCSYAEIAGPDLIAPERSATFQVILSPEQIPTEKTTATATFTTDSLLTPNVNLTLIAAAERFATLTPNVCDFGTIPPGTAHTKQVTLTVNAPLETAEIRPLSSGQESLNWTVTQEPTAGTFVITMELSPLKTLGTFGTLLTLAFPNGRTLTLPVTASVMPSVQSAPPILSYGLQSAGTHATVELTLSAEKPFTVLDIVTPNNVAVREMSESGTETRKQLAVTWRVPENTAAPLQTPIRVRTTADTAPISIPIYGAVHP